MNWNGTYKYCSNEKTLFEIMMAFHPADSLELNPDEQVWNHAKVEIGMRTIQSKDDMEESFHHLSKIYKY